MQHEHPDSPLSPTRTPDLHKPPIQKGPIQKGPIQKGPVAGAPSRALALGIAMAWMAGSGSAQGSSAVQVVPSERAWLEGSTSTNYPLGRHDARLQLLIAGLTPGSMLNGIAFRRDAIADAGPVQGFSTEMEITASVAPVIPDQAGNIFANNVGPNPLTVLPRTLVPFGATSRPGQDPAPLFDLAVAFSSPFQVPASGGTICLDFAMFSNVTANGPNRNFTARIDAHETFQSGRAEQPGFRSGFGCIAPGRNIPQRAQLELIRPAAGGLELDVAIRDGMPDNGMGNTLAWLAVGGTSLDLPIPGPGGCRQWVSLDSLTLLPGPLTTIGRWNGRLTAPALPPVGAVLYAQTASLSLTTGQLVVGDRSRLTMPPPGATAAPMVRVANGNDHTNPNGTVSRVVPVISLF